MSERLRLNVDDGSILADDGSVGTALHFYESSRTHADTDEPLVSVIVVGGGKGVRLTPSQATELRSWLDDWLTQTEAAP